MKKNERCQHEDCIYRMQETAGTRWHQCNYLYLTGELRTKGCTPEEALPCNCTKYVSNKKRKHKASKSQRPQKWWFEAERMWQEGKTVEEIAVATNHVPKTVKNALCSMGALTKKLESKTTDLDWELAFKLYRKNYSDQKIADTLGCKKWAVTEWRHKNKLESNYPGGKPKYG